MSNEITLTGFGGIALQDIGPKIQITQILGRSYEYNEMLDQLKTLEEFFALTPEDNTEKRLQLSAKINALKDRIEQFKKDVLQLAQAFQNIEIETNNVEINTSRLQRAKAYFEKGEFGQARAVFEMELEEMQDNQKRLLKEREKFEKETLPKLKHNSEEFYILALSTQSDYTNPNRFADTCRYFELSIESEATRENLFKYAFFLQEHNQFPKADNYYNLYLNQFADELSSEEKARTLHNLANLHRNQNEYEKASKEYKEALKIYRSLANDNSPVRLSDVATTLHNLAILHRNQNEPEKALKECEEALKIYRKLAEDNPQTYLYYVGRTLNNLAASHYKQKEYEKASKELEEALTIRRNLAKANPQVHLFYVAATLNNLAGVHWHQKKYKKALKEFEEALEIRRNLAKDNPQTYLPEVAMALNNLAVVRQNQKEYEKASKELGEALQIYRNLYEQMPNVYTPHLANTLINLSLFHQESLQEREKSLEYVTEAIMLLQPIIEAVPFTREYMQDALTVLRNWNLSDEEIERLIKEKMEEMRENQS
ncbi:MAG TPA: tetratricopeptide repeat protein [Pyrinomonadaceae bacterium]|jgi:tetratricopeptide (TPR) repeat protein